VFGYAEVFEREGLFYITHDSDDYMLGPKLLLARRLSLWL